VEESGVKDEYLSNRFVEIKDQGNAEYKAKSYLMSASKFGEGISLFHKHEAQCRKSADLLTKATQLYTNRCLSWHQLGNQSDAIKDATYVLDHIDSKNPKALYRRAHGYKSIGNLEKAIKDLEILV
jgi:tetratricopeptide (TPR) repeat protein